jgi:hypothetical protein
MTIWNWIRDLPAWSTVSILYINFILIFRGYQKLKLQEEPQQEQKND